jgi:hypothetical protein
MMFGIGVCIYYEALVLLNHMRPWNNIIVFILMLAMPVSSWASIAMGFHCQTSDSSSHSMHAQMDDGQTMHMNHQMVSEEINNDTDCECGCSGIFDCSVSGCHTTALLGDGEIRFRPFSQSISWLASAFVPSPDPHLLFRPPIFLS